VHVGVKTVHAAAWTSRCVEPAQSRRVSMFS
jgi:hypothetical protein